MKWAYSTNTRTEFGNKLQSLHSEYDLAKNHKLKAEISEFEIRLISNLKLGVHSMLRFW